MSSSPSNARDRLDALKTRRAARLSCPSTADQSARSPSRQAADPSVRWMPPISSPSPQTSSPQAGRGRAGQPPMRDPTPLIPVVVDGPQADTWALLAKRSEEQLMKERIAAKVAHQKKMTEQKKVLDEQVELRRGRKAAERAKFLAERSLVDGEYQEWVDDHKAEVVERRHVMNTIGEDRQNQINMRKATKEAEAARNDEADTNILRNIQLQEEGAKERKLEFRRRQESMRLELIAANEDLKARKEQEKVSDAEWLRGVQEEMHRREEMDFHKREEEAIAFKERVKGREAMAMKLQATVEQRAAADEKRAKAIMRQREAEADERERVEEAKRNNQKHTVLSIRAAQVEERTRLRAIAEQEKLAERVELDGLVDEEQRAKQRRLEEAREKQRSCREDAERQLKERARYHRVVMSEEELRLNRQLLQGDSPLPHISPPPF